MTAVIRAAEPRDILCLQDIEDAADALLVEYLKAAEWSSAPNGATRESTEGFILIAADTSHDRAFGFAHVIVGPEVAHLEQLSVVPERGKRGVGRALVEAAKLEAVRRGFAVMTLRTYADVPWNAPFYRSCGFEESETNSQFHRGLIEAEVALGVDRYGRRVQMSARLR